MITDAVAASIIRDVIAPRFREQRYAAGLDAAVDAVFARIGGGPAPPPRRPAPWSSADPATVLLFALFFGVFGVAIFSALAVASICGVCFSVGPAIRASHTPLVETLKEGGRVAGANLAPHKVDESHDRLCGDGLS